MVHRFRLLCAAALLSIVAQTSWADDSQSTATQSASPQPVLVDIATTSADDGGLCTDCDAIDWNAGCQSRWTVSAGAIFLHRSAPDPNQISHPVGSTTTVANGSDFNFGTAVGPDFSIARQMNSGNSFQFRFFGALDSNAGRDYGPVGNVQLGSFSNFGATNLTSTYNSRLYSTEFNWLRPIGDRFTFIAGFRQLEIREQLDYNITFPAFTAVYSWKDLNQLYGGQMGANVRLWRDDSRLSMNCALKAGVFGNTATNSFNLLPSTGGSFPAGASAVQTAFVGDISFTASYQLTKHLAIRGGYQLLWVQDLALASNQASQALANATQSGINTRGDLFYNGATAGMVYLW